MANRHVKVLTGASAANDTGTGPVDTHGAPGVVMYVRFGAGTTAGAVKLQGSPVKDQAGGVQASDANWVDLGTVTWAAADRTQRLAVAEGHRFLRAKISTAIVGGTVDVHIHTNGFAGGSYLEAD